MFLDICETTISQLNNEPSAKEIKEITNTIIDLFRELSDKKEVLLDCGRTFYYLF